MIQPWQERTTDIKGNPTKNNELRMEAEIAELRTELAARAKTNSNPVAWRLRNTSFRGIRYEYFTHEKDALWRQTEFNRSVDDGSLLDLTRLYL